jgi:hypothetical protein
MRVIAQARESKLFFAFFARACFALFAVKLVFNAKLAKYEDAKTAKKGLSGCAVPTESLLKLVSKIGGEVDFVLDRVAGNRLVCAVVSTEGFPLTRPCG